MRSPYSLIFTNPIREPQAIESKYYDPATDLLSQLVPEGWPNPDKLSTASAYEINGWFRRCLDLRAETLASVPYTIRDSAGGEILYDSESFDPLPMELEWLQELEDLQRLAELSLILAGKAYWRPLMVRGRRTGIQYVDPTTVKEEYNDRGNIVAYIREYTSPTGGMVRERWAPDEVVAFYQRDPFTEVGPGAPLGEAVRRNADVLNSIHTFLDSFLDKGLLPASLVSLPANTTPAERTRFQALWDRAYRGKHKAGNQLVVNADAVRVEKLGEGLSDISTPDLVQEQREAIAAALGIPMSHLLPSAANRATSFQDDENLYTKAIIPQCKRRQIAANVQLFAPAGLYFRYEFKRIEALQRANLEKARAAFAITGVPIMTRNESRNVIGLPGVDGGDVFGDDIEAVRQAELAQMQLEAAEAQAEPEQDDKMEARAFQELDNWKRKVKKVGSTVEWTREHIPEHVYDTIKARLDRGQDWEHAFSPPYSDF